MKEKKREKKATTFLIFQDFKEITIISYKVIIVISNIITHTHTHTQHTAQYIGYKILSKYINKHE